MEEVLGAIESFLGDHDWLSGPSYGLADISWIVNAQRLLQAEYALGAYPRLLNWHERVVARPAFDRAVVSYHPN